MGELYDFKTKKLVREEPPTPEKPKEGSYLDTLKAKRDVLSSHYTLNQLRKGKKIEEMSNMDIEDYKSVKKEFDRRRELFLASFSNLDEDDGQKVAELTSLIKVEITLSSLGKSTETETEATPAPEGTDQPVTETPAGAIPEDLAGETRIRPEGLSEPEPQVEIPARDMTLEEIDLKIAFAKRQTLGLKDESTEYWEAQKALLLERQEAEANPDRPAPKGFLQRVRDSYNRAKDTIADRFAGANAIRGDSETVESRMSPLGLRKEAMESLSPAEPSESAQPIQPEAQPQSETTPQQLEKEPKKPSGWGWLKERGKGLLTAGIWEFSQAEKFRSKTKEVAGDTKVLATLIQQERNLSLEEAEKEAWETVEELKKSNLDISAPEFYQANKDITERKSKENSQEIEYIIKSAGNDLLEKLAKYRGEAGQNVLTQENKLAFQADLRGELNKIRDGATRKDFINFAKLMRRNLDENWQWRYVWGTAEALAWCGVGWASMKFLASKEAAAVATMAVAGGAGGTEAAKKFIETGMHENVWNTLKSMAENGPGHFTPTGEQLKDWSQAVLDSIKHYEPEWINNTVEGLKSSRAMPEGTMLKIPLEITKAMGY